MATKKRTRINKVPEGHTVAYHEALTCVVCKREFWGACAWDAHWPCNNAEFLRTAHQLYRIPDKDVTYFRQDVEPFVLLDCKERYCRMMKNVANMHGGSRD